MPTEVASRLALGTAQLGFDYGVANRTGVPAARHAETILSRAYDHGIRILDTSRHYGESERVIGRFLRRHPTCDFKNCNKETARSRLSVRRQSTSVS